MKGCTIISLCISIVLPMVILSQELASSIKSCSECHLPECYCKPKHSPARALAGKKPQMIILTYSGKVVDDVTDTLTDLFYTSKLKNPNGCGIGVTLFIDGVDTDYCEVHKLYSLGWEVSTNGNTTSATPTWNETVWEMNTDGHRQGMIERARMKVDEVIGFRSPDHRTSSDETHFNTLWENGFTYDSTLSVYNPTGTENDTQVIQPWPFTLDLTLSKMNLHNIKGDPNKQFPGLWEVPLTRMRHNSSTSRTCDYLHTCLGGLSKSSELTDLLKYNLLFNEFANQAPLQINLRERDIYNTRLMKGLNEFLRWALHGEDTHYWVMSIDQLLRWMQTPAINREMVDGVGADDLCTKRRKYHKCGKAKNRRQRMANPFREVIDVDHLWIYQSVVLFFSYWIVKQYDRGQKS